MKCFPAALGALGCHPSSECIPAAWAVFLCPWGSSAAEFGSVLLVTAANTGMDPLTPSGRLPAPGKAWIWCNHVREEFLHGKIWDPDAAVALGHHMAQYDLPHILLVGQTILVLFRLFPVAHTPDHLGWSGMKPLEGPVLQKGQSTRDTKVPARGQILTARTVTNLTQEAETAGPGMWLQSSSGKNSVPGGWSWTFWTLVGVWVNSVSLLRAAGAADGLVPAHPIIAPGSWVILCLGLKATPSTPVPGLSQWMPGLKWRNPPFPMRKESTTLSSNIETLWSQLNWNKISCSTISGINSSLFRPTVGKQLEHLVGRCKEGEKQNPKLKSQNWRDLFLNSNL